MTITVKALQQGYSPELYHNIEVTFLLEWQFSNVAKKQSDNKQQINKDAPSVFWQMYTCLVGLWSFPIPHLVSSDCWLWKKHNQRITSYRILYVQGCVQINHGWMLSVYMRTNIKTQAWCVLGLSKMQSNCLCSSYLTNVSHLSSVALKIKPLLLGFEFCSQVKFVTVPCTNLSLSCNSWDKVSSLFWKSSIVLCA